MKTLTKKQIQTNNLPAVGVYKATPAAASVIIDGAGNSEGMCALGGTIYHTHENMVLQGEHNSEIGDIEYVVVVLPPAETTSLQDRLGEYAQSDFTRASICSKLVAKKLSEA